MVKDMGRAIPTPVGLDEWLEPIDNRCVEHGTAKRLLRDYATAAHASFPKYSSFYYELKQAK